MSLGPPALYVHDACFRLGGHGQQSPTVTRSGISKWLLRSKTRTESESNRKFPLSEIRYLPEFLHSKFVLFRMYQIWEWNFSCKHFLNHLLDVHRPKNV
ncbi:unnamed protein product [Acanthosepion pharaonis]|uniref:Uncharacterized protein n=1 Tax=Acanthosepion pharaonis TaxID=158019 RepID=A0A812AQ49_ACAPH|nr:unnamed protein product [Sepia pharaonis]